MILTAALKLYCQLHNITTRQIEKETGVSQSTVSRFLRGENIESDNYVRLMTWAQQPTTQPPHPALQKTPNTTAPHQQ